MLHDIGVAVDYDDHHKHSRYLILNAGLPGFSPRETALIGQAARYHRKGTPGLGEFAPVAREGDAAQLDRIAASCGSPSSSNARATRPSARATSTSHDGRVELRLHASEDVRSPAGRPSARATSVRRDYVPGRPLSGRTSPACPSCEPEGTSV